MNIVENLTGLRFGKLTAIKISGKSARGEHAKWVCACDCGGYCIVRSGNLKSGNTISCGCYKLHRTKTSKNVGGYNKLIVMFGQKFGNLTVIKENGRIRRGVVYECKCDCGKVVNVIGSILKKGQVSCGCKRKENVIKSATKHGHASGGKPTPEFRAWVSMKSRCYNTEYIQYKDYGGRGISVCERWLYSFENFLLDMGLKPNSRYSLERSDNNLGYSKDNCIWAVRGVQCRNRRSNVWIEHFGQKKVLKDWAIELGVSSVLITYYLKRDKNFSWVYSYFINKRKAA